MKRVKRGITAVLALTMVLNLCGCTKKPEEVVYPQNGDQENILTEEGIKDSTVTVSEDGRICYDVTDSKGTPTFLVNAKVIKEDKDYSVVEVGMTPNLEDHDGFNTLVSGIFDKDTIKVVLPPEVADQEYVRNRIDTLEKRMADYPDEEIPNAFSMELRMLKDVEENSDYSTKYTISCPEKPTVINLKEYYEREHDYDCDISFCFIEGEIGGELYEADYINYRGCWTVRIYRPRNAYGMGDGKYLIGEEGKDESLFEGNGFTEDSAKIAADTFLGKIYGVFESDFAGCYPIDIYGDIKENGEHIYDKPGYLLFTNNMPRASERPVTAYTDYYGLNRCSTNPCLSAPLVTMLADPYIAANAKDVDNLDDGLGYCGSCYENISVTVGEDGVDEVYICNLMGLMSVKTSAASLLAFEEINERAQKELAILADMDPVNNRAFEIDRIELGMTKVESDGHQYLVPAWFFLEKPESQNVLPVPALCLNAIDGSTIDLSNGGLTSQFSLTQ